MSTTDSTTPDFTTSPDEQAESKSDNERTAKLRKAYGSATQKLREAHRDEFDTLYEQDAKALGVDYKRKPSAEEKAEADLKALLEAHPGLRDKIDTV
jgi:hypothetical protein